MLPRSSERGTGNIGLLQWLRIGWNYLWTPRFNPMEVGYILDIWACLL